MARVTDASELTNVCDGMTFRLIGLLSQRSILAVRVHVQRKKTFPKNEIVVSAQSGRIERSVLFLERLSMHKMQSKCDRSEC